MIFFITNPTVRKPKKACPFIWKTRPVHLRTVNKHQTLEDKLLVTGMPVHRPDRHVCKQSEPEPSAWGVFYGG